MANNQVINLRAGDTQAAEPDPGSHGQRPSEDALAVQITPSTQRYLQRLFELGIFAGPVGGQTLHPALIALVDAAHQVLAGGSATVQVTTPGNPQVVAELQGLAKDGTDEANAANQRAGVSIMALPP